MWLVKPISISLQRTSWRSLALWCSKNSFNPEYISGGSSSGSSVVVANGMVPFSLGTDTAGSGRVPAGHNNIVVASRQRAGFLPQV